MQNKELTKQIIDFQKKAFETGFSSMAILQEQTSGVVNNFLKQSPWIPQQTKSIFNEWSNMCKEGAANFKETADQNYAKLEEILSSGCDAFKTKTKK